MGGIPPARIPDQGVPAWSGLFWEDEDFGYISVHVSDTRTYHAPAECWSFVRTYADPDDDAQVFEYRKVCVRGRQGQPEYLLRGGG